MLLNKVRLADGLGSPEGKPKWASRPRGAAQCHPGVLVLLLGATCMACGFAAGATCFSAHGHRPRRLGRARNSAATSSVACKSQHVLLRAAAGHFYAAQVGSQAGAASLQLGRLLQAFSGTPAAVCHNTCFKASRLQAHLLPTTGGVNHYACGQTAACQSDQH